MDANSFKCHYAGMSTPAVQAIFFDIETSDLSPVGQILNFCFTLTDTDFQVVDELSGTIKISRLQLPRAGAIRANHIRVLQHQETAAYAEFEAMRVIHEFITTATRKNRNAPTSLIGYNSARFDLDYLRTSMIRNGFNPFFRVAYKDLLFASRKLAVSNPDFPRGERPDAAGRASLSLESLCQSFGLLRGSQAHESRDDVRLTIELARFYRKRFGLDVRTYMPYEPLADLHKGRHSLIYRRVPEYDLERPERVQVSPYVLLDSSHKYALWINLRRFEELEGSGRDSRRAIEFFKFEGSDFFTDGEEVSDPACQTLADRALKAFSNVSLANYFTETDCDIEAHIYRIDFSFIEYLQRLLQTGAPARDAPEDIRRLVTRWKLANAAEESERLKSVLRQYALFRYGGRMKINRFSEAQFKEGVYSADFHPTFAELRHEVRTAIESSTGEELECMKQLLSFYERSAIYRAAGTELENIHRKTEEPVTA